MIEPRLLKIASRQPSFCSLVTSMVQPELQNHVVAMVVQAVVGDVTKTRMMMTVLVHFAHLLCNKVWSSYKALAESVVILITK